MIQVRLREGRDDDIAAWYAAQEDKSETVRRAIRAYMRLQNGDTQESVVREAVARELARLPDVVASAVRETLAAYSLTIGGAPSPSGVDPELDNLMDSQLGQFFSE